MSFRRGRQRDPAAHDVGHILIPKAAGLRLRIMAKSDKPVGSWISAAIDVAQQSIRKRGLIVRIERRVIGRCASVQSLAKPSHISSYAQISYSDFAHRAIEIGGHEVDQRLGHRCALFGFEFTSSAQAS